MFLVYRFLSGLYVLKTFTLYTMWELQGFQTLCKLSENLGNSVHQNSNKIHQMSESFQFLSELDQYFSELISLIGLD